MIQTICIRFRLAWAVITGRYTPTQSIERMIFMSDLAKTNAALLALNASADALIAKSKADDVTITTNATVIADTDDAVSAQVAAVTAKMDAAVPAPAPAPAPTPTA
jgi:hypothetical protein